MKIRLELTELPHLINPATGGHSAVVHIFWADAEDNFPDKPDFYISGANHQMILETIAQHISHDPDLTKMRHDYRKP